MKKTITLTLIVVMIFSAFCLYGCKRRDALTVAMYVPDGAPALAVANVIDSKKIGDDDVSVSITTGADVQAKILAGEADVAVCPTNMAATLYNKGVDYKLLTANVFGLLYLMGASDAQISSLEDLKGKVVHSIGKGNTPQFVFQKIVSESNIEMVESDVDVEGKIAVKFYDAGSAIIPLLKSGNIEFAILGEPAATKSGAKEIFDLQNLWKEATGLEESYPQAGVFVKSALLKDKVFVSALIKALEECPAYLAANATSVAEMLGANGSNDLKSANFTAEVLARCNVRCKKAVDCRQELIDYFEAVASVNSSFVLPDDGFYAVV